MLDIEALARNVELFDGHYALIRPLSVDGATADVWLALDTNTLSEQMDISKVVNLQDHEIEKLGLVVAIKIYRPQNALDIEGEMRFKKEYMIVFNCTHTNLIHPAHFSIFKETPYLVLPYCKLGSSELLAGNLREAKDIWKYLYDVASGLDYLHTKCTPPIIHLDMKPANVLINDHGSYAITDFGISAKHEKRLFSDVDDVSGTTAYMSPERFGTDYIPSAPSDIWALGATIFELITGRVPYGEEGGAGQSQGNEMYPMPAHLPNDVVRVIKDCLNINPDKRPTASRLMEIAEKHLKHYTSGNGEKKELTLPKVNLKLFFIIGAVLLTLGLGALIISALSDGDDAEASEEVAAQPTDNPQEKKTAEEVVKQEVKVPASILLAISDARKALQRGEAFLKEHPDMINSENGLGEDYYIEAFRLFSDLQQKDAAEYPDSIHQIINKGIDESQQKLNVFYSKLEKLSKSSLQMVSEPAKERMNKINELLKK